MQRKIAVVLSSGGMDSSLCAGLAKAQGYAIAALHLNYGQKTEDKELECFNAIADHYNAVARLVVDVNYFSQIGGSSLTDPDMPVEKGNIEAEDIPSSYVPFRNANILAIATSWAEILKAGAIFVGAVEDDSSGYPDCRKTFFESFQETIRLGTRPETQIEIITPIINMSKSEIVAKAVEIGLPLEKTWSCYQSSDEACGECDSCLLRLRGFDQAGLKDVIPYK